MALRSGHPLWPAISGSPHVVGNIWSGQERCEVAVLGAGITGALIADALVREGVDVVLLDKRKLGEGSTAASTGLLQYEIDTPLIDLIAKVGEDHAVHAYRRGLRAIDELEQLAVDVCPVESVTACGFARRDSLYFASHFWHARRLRREYDCRKKYGFNVDFLSREQLSDISSIAAPCAIRSYGDAQMDPYRFTQALLRRAMTNGLRAYERLEVESIDENDADVVLHTTSGTVTCDRIVYASGYDSYRYLDDHDGKLHSTYAVASDPVDDFPGWPDGALIWETARPYFYARQSHDRRIIIGGADTSFSTDHQRDDLIARKSAKLMRRFQRMFPEIAFESAFKWAGTFGESKDGLAYIGQPPGRDRAYFAIGYGGNGITFSAIAAKLITDLYFDRPNEDAAVFRFGR